LDVTNSRNKEIRKVIDQLQIGLVELFDQLAELRRLLDLASVDLPSDSAPVTRGLFSRVMSEKEAAHETDRFQYDSGEMPIEEKEDARETELSVAARLDPIAHEVREGNSPARQIAVMLESAKRSLLTPDSPRVENDMDIVLKFLRARGDRGIRPEERENILRRIDRWKLYLSRS
jgi:hypothetical protein